MLHHWDAYYSELALLHEAGLERAAPTGHFADVLPVRFLMMLVVGLAAVSGGLAALVRLLA
jgi:hypothetical protein